MSGGDISGGLLGPDITFSLLIGLAQILFWGLLLAWPRFFGGLLVSLVQK